MAEQYDGGGWSYHFLEDIDHDLSCIICMFPMKEPQQISTCGHSMCKTCLEEVIRRNPICPEDRQPIEKSTIFPDLKCNRKVMALRVKCQFSDTGCEWNGELVDLIKKHLNECKEEVIPCSKKECCKTPTRDNYKWHLENECGWRLVKCEYCQDEIVSCKMVEHLLQVCEGYPISCKNCCGSLIQRNKMECHLEKCINRIVQCQYAAVGCTEKMMAKNTESHLDSNVRHHVDQVFEAFLCEKKENEILKVNMEKLDEENRNMRTNTEKLCEDIRNLTTTVESLKKEKQDLEENLEKLKGRHDAFEETLKDRSFGESTNNLIQQTKSFIKQTGEDMMDLRKELKSVASLTNCDDDFLNLYKENLDCDPDYVEFIWKIDNFQMHWDRSKEDAMYEIQSPVYRTGLRGYHFRLDSCLDEDGSLSIYATIMQGSDDNILPWPFKLSREFSLLNVNKQDTITSLFSDWKSETGMALYPKPKGQEGTGSGDPRLIEHTKLFDHGFIIDDTVFVKFKLPKFSAV